MFAVLYRSSYIATPLFRTSPCRYVDLNSVDVAKRKWHKIVLIVPPTDGGHGGTAKEPKRMQGYMLPLLTDLKNYGPAGASQAMCTRTCASQSLTEWKRLVSVSITGCRCAWRWDRYASESAFVFATAILPCSQRCEVPACASFHMQWQDVLVENMIHAVSQHCTNMHVWTLLVRQFCCM